MLLLKTFARRYGRSLSEQKKWLINSLLPSLTFSPEKISPYLNDKEIILEIGFGMGEHLIHKLETEPDKFYIGAEVYLPGVANLLKFCYDKNIKNILIWPDSIDLIMESIANNYLSTIFILFPDPWPKKKQQKKRLINPTRINLLADKLKCGGKIIFASDIDDYFISSQKTIEMHPNLSVCTTNYLTDYIQTKYHKLAILANRQPKFLIATKYQK